MPLIAYVTRTKGVFEGILEFLVIGAYNPRGSFIVQDSSTLNNRGDRPGSREKPFRRAADYIAAPEGGR